MLKIIYEDNHLLVLDKPAGLLTQPSGTNQTNLESEAKKWLKEVYHKPGSVFLEAAHRLDKCVSGVVVFAKTSKAISRLNQSLRDKNVVKKYCAWVEGAVTPIEGRLENYLVHDDHFAWVGDQSNGKLALLSYKCLEKKDNYSYVEIFLETGRYHQIRAQFAHLGFPIVGDLKYGSRHPLLNERIALHHAALTIPHPITKSLMTFKVDPPFMNGVA